MKKTISRKHRRDIGLGPRLKAEREKLFGKWGGLTKLAAATKLPVSQLSKYERGKAQPSSASQTLLLRALGRGILPPDAGPIKDENLKGDGMSSLPRNDGTVIKVDQGMMETAYPGATEVVCSEVLDAEPGQPAVVRFADGTWTIAIPKREGESYLLQPLNAKYKAETVASSMVVKCCKIVAIHFA